MSAEAAARLGDEIAHGFGLLAMVAGAVVGVAAGVAVVGATALTGGLAAVVIAGAVAGGGLAGGQLMDGLNTVFNLPEPTSGVIATGSPNVLTNLRPAVRAMLDVAGCSGLPFNHPPLPMPVPVAEGSATVLINGMPASRLKSKLMCGAHLKTGSQNVIIGGETARLGFVFDLEAWTKTGLQILGLGALIGGGLFAAAAGLAAFGLFAGTVVVGGAAFEGLGMIGDAIGPGYRDLLQGIAGLGLVAAGPKLAGPKTPGPGTGPPARPSWRTSEVDVGARLQGQGYRAQTSFKNRVEVPYGTKGSVRPEYYKPGSSIEVKNYNVQTPAGRSNLVRNVSGQAKSRATNLPAGTRQEVYIDIRGQTVPRSDLNTMVNNIVTKSNGALQPGDIKFLR